MTTIKKKAAAGFKKEKGNYRHQAHSGNLLFDVPDIT